MLVLRCKNCSETFNLKLAENPLCPSCGEIVDGNTVTAIQSTLNQLTKTVNQVQDSGWDLFLSTDNTFIRTLNYPDGTVEIPHMLFLNKARESLL